MGYQNAPATVTVTQDGQPVDIRPDFETKTVAVFIGGEWKGTFKDRTSARLALDLVDVPAKGRRA